jgi:hypothetical protein
MDEQTFKSKIFHAEVMRDIEDRPDYSAGYCRGLQRAFHGEQFGTEAEHVHWSSLADREDMQDHERGRGYLDGLMRVNLTSR